MYVNAWSCENCIQARGLLVPFVDRAVRRGRRDNGRHWSHCQHTFSSLSGSLGVAMKLALPVTGYMHALAEQFSWLQPCFLLQDRSVTHTMAYVIWVTLRVLFFYPITDGDHSAHYWLRVQLWPTKWGDATWTKDGQTVSFELPCLFMFFSHDSENTDRREAGKMGKKHGDQALSSHTRQQPGSLTFKLSKRATTVGMSLYPNATPHKCVSMDTLATGIHNAHPAYCVHPRVLRNTPCHALESVT